MSTVNRIVNINTNDKHLKSDNTEDFKEDEQILDDENEGALDEEDNQDVTDKEGDKDEPILERFKGKSAADISKAYSELEALNGRLSNEVGDYRKMARDWLFENGQSKDNKGDRKATKELTDEDFIDKPSDAVSALVKDKLDPVLKRLEKVDTNLMIAEFQRVNPDYKEIVSSQEFNDWIKASPYRIRQYQKADNMDLDAATDLLQGYREVRNINKLDDKKPIHIL
mgnify:CR=1 FL=1